jgi:hypothetical protein
MSGSLAIFLTAAESARQSLGTRTVRVKARLGAGSEAIGRADAAAIEELVTRAATGTAAGRAALSASRDRENILNLRGLPRWQTSQFTTDFAAMVQAYNDLAD